MAIQRHVALNKYKSATAEYIENMTKENYESMQLLQRYYQSFQRKIYTHENIIEMCSLMGESTDDKIILDELDGYLVSLVMSRTKMPMLTVKAIEKKHLSLDEMPDSKLKRQALRTIKMIDDLKNA